MEFQVKVMLEITALSAHTKGRKFGYVDICSAADEENVLSGCMSYLHVAASSFLQLLQLTQANHLHCIHYALHPYKGYNHVTFSVVRYWLERMV
jgi:hypothetical protein